MPAISARGLTKRYRSGDSEFAVFSALDLDIESGESVALTGESGAGKSTLLKILSRVTTPTKGRVRLRGRVASLLEVGTGFHPDFTGRENVYAYLAQLGVTGETADLTIYRVVQEALTNVTRHSGARNVHIRLVRRQAQLTIKVRDDGAGAPAAQAFTHGPNSRNPESTFTTAAARAYRRKRTQHAVAGMIERSCRLEPIRKRGLAPGCCAFNVVLAQDVGCLSHFPESR